MVAVLGGRSGIERARRWFDRYGGRAVFIGRLLPVVRTFISLPAGYARMRPVRFGAYTAVGCVPWIGGLAWAGYAAGANWQHVQRTAAKAGAGRPVTASGRPGAHRRERAAEDELT